MNGGLEFLDLVPGFIGAALVEFAKWRPAFVQEPREGAPPISFTWRHFVVLLVVLSMGSVTGLLVAVETLFEVQAVIWGFVAAGLIEGTISVRWLIFHVSRNSSG